MLLLWLPQDARLRLVRGRRYGLCGANGVGKVRRSGSLPHGVCVRPGQRLCSPVRLQLA